MLRVDGAYLYDISNTLKSISNINEEDITSIHLYFTIFPARNAVEQIVFQSIFSSGFHVVHTAATNLLKKIDEHMPDLGDTSTFEIPVHRWIISSIKQDFQQFEAVLRAEMQSMALYYVSPKGGFDNRNLIDNGSQIFPSELLNKAPEAMVDVLVGARCLAFELWTAMGFHFHRANEAVLRRYYESVIGDFKRPKNLTMGTILSSMEQHNVGDSNIKAALKNITVFHRNPLAHPDHNLENSDEAIALYAAIRAAIGYMLEKLPNVPIETKTVNISEIVPPVIEVQ